MNTCTTKHSFSKIILEYVGLLIKCEQLHNKLEQLCLNTKTQTTQLIKNNIIKINNKLNFLLVKLMKYQWLIEVLTPLYIIN